MTCTTSPPLAVWIANQNMARITLEMMATVYNQRVSQGVTSGSFSTVRAPESPTCARQYRERSMIQHANGTIERNHNADGEEGRCHDPKRIFIAQPDSKHRCGELPRCGIESITEPVGDQAEDGPLPVFSSDGIKIWERTQAILVGGTEHRGGASPYLY